MNKVCSWCRKEIKPGEPFDFLLGSYSHKRCDEKGMEKIEKNVKNIYRKDSFS